MRVRDLHHSYFDGADIQLRTQHRLWGIQVLRSAKDTFTVLTRGHRETARRCGGLVSSVDTQADELVVSVPTTCIEDPPWVRGPKVPRG